MTACGLLPTPTAFQLLNSKCEPLFQIAAHFMQESFYVFNVYLIISPTPFCPCRNLMKTCSLVALAVEFPLGTGANYVQRMLSSLVTSFICQGSHLPIVVSKDAFTIRADAAPDAGMRSSRRHTVFSMFSQKASLMLHPCKMITPGLRQQQDRVLFM